MASKEKEVDGSKNNRRIIIGKRGEDHAAAFLMKQGFQIIERNWRKKNGEIDLIARRGKEYRIVEVKTRVSPRGGSPLESITDRKLQTINDLAMAFFMQKKIREPEYHLDVITIEVRPNGKATLRYIPDIQ